MGKERQVAEQILQYVGGKENILNVEHCATRLRLVLKDAGAFRKKEIEEIEGVKGSFLASGQHQVVLGTGFVNKVYAEVMDLTGFDQGGMMTKADATAVHMNVFQMASRLLGDVFLPIIPILVATGLFMGVRSLITNLGVQLDPTLLSLSQVLIDTAFGFLPALVTYSVMKRFGASPALGFVIGLMLVAPQLPNANQVASGAVEPMYLNLAGLSIPIVGYQGSVLPALILGIIAAKMEKGLRKVVPDVLDLIVTPFMTLLGSLVVGLVVIGPVMHLVEKWLVAAIAALMNIPLGIGGFLVGALQQAVVITGLHHTFKDEPLQHPGMRRHCSPGSSRDRSRFKDPGQEAEIPLFYVGGAGIFRNYGAADLRRKPAQTDSLCVRLYRRRMRRCLLIPYGTGRHRHVHYGSSRHAAVFKRAAWEISHCLRHRVCGGIWADLGAV